jgi:hypothetical protein
VLNLLQEIPGWLSVLVAAGGAVVSGLSLGRSRWAMLLLGGFSAEAVALAFSRVALLGIRSGVWQPSNLGVAFAATSFLGLAGRVLVVAGVAGVLAERRSAPVSAETQTSS